MAKKDDPTAEMWDRPDVQDVIKRARWSRPAVTRRSDG